MVVDGAAVLVGVGGGSVVNVVVAGVIDAEAVTVVVVFG
jgi:hypothetical protein